MHNITLNKLTAGKLAALPVADDSMTKARLRQLCMDFFALQLSFQWTSDTDIADWPVTYAKNKDKSIKKGAIYGGIPYQSYGNGNLYRWLEYYDQKTGVMHFGKAFRENGGYGEGADITDVKTDENGNITYKKYRSFMALFNQCSSSSFWGWGRVVNSASFNHSFDMTVRNGFIPVGCYTYPGAEKIEQFGRKSDSNPNALGTADVIEYVNSTRGENGIYECYAKMKPADCVTGKGHTMMVRGVELKYLPDGTPDYENSTVRVLEQTEAWGFEGELDGKEYKVQGHPNGEYTMSKLKEKCYIPFTFAELLDPDDPQDKEHLDYYYSYRDKIPHFEKEYAVFGFSADQIEKMTGVKVEKAIVFNTLKKAAGAVSLADFKEMTVGANYPISDLFVTAFDKNGKEIIRNVHRCVTNRTRAVAMSANKSTREKDENGELLPVSDGLEKAAGGKVKVELRLSTGELLRAFEGTLI